MATYSMIYPPIPEPHIHTVWDRRGNEWREEPCVGKWICTDWDQNYHETAHIVLNWGRLVEKYGPLTDTPPHKVGDTISAAQAFELPPESVIWPLEERTGNPRALTFNHVRRYVGRTAQVSESDALANYHGEHYKILQIGGCE